MIKQANFRNAGGRPIELLLARLLEGHVEGGVRVVVSVGTPERLDAVDSVLWTYDRGAFLPHGSRKDGYAERQPVWLTTENDNPNGATVLAVLDDAFAQDCEGIDVLEYFFDRSDRAALGAARQRWVALRDAGAALTYMEYDGQQWNEADLRGG